MEIIGKSTKRMQNILRIPAFLIFHTFIFGVMDKTGAKKRRSPYAVRLSGVESL